MLSSSPYWPSSTASNPPSRSSSSSTLVDDLVIPPPPPPPSQDSLVSLDDLPTLVSGKITRSVINYLVDRVSGAVDFGLNRPSSSKQSRSTSHRERADAERDTFTQFLTTVLRRAEATLSTIIGALVYIDRARPYLSIAIEQWAHHRVFLGALIVASKYLNDASLKNAHWALCTGVFGRRDVQRIEREFLDVLAWELAVTEDDLVRICSRMVKDGVLVRPNATATVAGPAATTKEVQMDVDGKQPGAGQRSSNASLCVVRALWDEKARREMAHSHSHPRSSERKRGQSDVDMDVDDSEVSRARRRKSACPSPVSSDMCSTCSTYSSPATSDDSVSPRTPPPPPAHHNHHHALPSLGQQHRQYALPGYAGKIKFHPHQNLIQLSKSISSGGMQYPPPPPMLLDTFPSVPQPPVPTPALALSPVQAPTAPPPLPSLPPYAAAAFPLSRAFPASHPHLRPHSARPASPYARPSLSAGVAASRSMTPFSHKRSSAVSSMPPPPPPSLYPAYIPAASA